MEHRFGVATQHLPQRVTSFFKGPVHGRTAALMLIMQPYHKDDRFFRFFLLMEHRRNDIERGKPKYKGKNLPQWHFVHHKSHMD
jgi:hypothetical protein